MDLQLNGRILTGHFDFPHRLSNQLGWFNVCGLSAGKVALSLPALTDKFGRGA